MEETIAVLSICLSVCETEELRIVAPELYEKLRNDQTE